MANPYLVNKHTPEGKSVEIQGEGVKIKAYEARPQGVQAAPGVIVIHENRGLVPYLRDVADALASAGYVAVAPDLLSEEGGTDAVVASGKDIPSILPDIPREGFVKDGSSVGRYLRDEARATRLGIIGFCFGGGITWRYATADPDLAAAVPFYGANPPLEAVPNIEAAVYAVYGGEDERINQGIPAIQDALKKAGVTHDMKVYPGAPHAFHNHTNAERYRPEAAKQAWNDALAWLDKYLNA